MGRVYLAGPIAGLSYDGCTNWREETTAALSFHGIQALSSMRFKQYLATEGEIKDSYAAHTLSTAEGITARDRFDVQRCDVVLMNLLGAKKVSIGTMIEAGWADAFRKPVVLVIEKGNIHHHAILGTIAAFHVTTLEEGIAVATSLIGEQ